MADPPSGTVTFLFTDIEGSTRLWEDYPDAMPGALVRHDAILRDAVESAGGHVVKTTGDGFFARRAEAALGAAQKCRYPQSCCEPIRLTTARQGVDRSHETPRFLVTPGWAYLFTISAAARRIFVRPKGGYRFVMQHRCGCGPPRTVSRRDVLKFAAAAPVALGLGTAATVLIAAPKAPADPQWSAAVLAPGQPPTIISRALWGADESMRSGTPLYDNGIKAGIVHHTATSNDYSPQDSAGIVRGIYGYHTRTLGWSDIAYNALVDKYGRVFEGRFGGVTRPVEGSHTGGFNTNTWAVAMIGNFDEATPTPDQLHSVGLLLGWRLAMDGVDPKGSVRLTSAGGPYTRFAQGVAPTLPSIFAHRDVGDTACPGSIGYASLDRIRDIAAGFNKPASSQDLADLLKGGAIYARWQAMGGINGPLGAPTSPETPGEGSTRYVTFDKGAIYWSPASGAAPVTGAIYDAWASLGFERSALGLPTSAEIQEPEWIVQNFQHGTLNFDRQNSSVVRVMDGVAVALPPPSPTGPPVQLERFSPARNRV